MIPWNQWETPASKTAGEGRTYFFKTKIRFTLGMRGWLLRTKKTWCPPGLKNRFLFLIFGDGDLEQKNLLLVGGSIYFYFHPYLGK